MRRVLPVVLLVAAVSGCASRPASNPVARLEARRDANPNAAKTLRALGVAYYRAGRFSEAQRVLGRARDLAPGDGVTALYLGMAAEETSDLATARAAYESYVRHGRTSRVRTRLRARLTLLARRELEVEAKAAVAREASFGTEPGSPRTIAVLPLDFVGRDSSLAPLGAGLADLLITDLSRVGQLTVVERQRLDALLDEISRSATGRVDSATAVRSGRLVRAGRLIRGAISQPGESALRADAAVVDVATARTAGPVNADFALDAVLDAEKRIVVAILEQLGVTPTPAERAAIEQRPTRSLAAFLAYSRGVAAENAGRWNDAARHFGDAARQDPGFAAARAAEARAQQTAIGAAATPALLQSSLAGSEAATAAAAQSGSVADAGSLAGTLAAARDDLNPSPAAAATTTTPGASLPTKEGPAQATGTDSPILNGGRIIIKVPLP